jgi:serine/threonine protein kinase
VPVRGETLRARMQRVHRLSWPEAIDIAMQICEGLAAAHAATLPVLHLRISPETIVLSDRRVTLVGFDVAWMAKHALGQSTAGFDDLRYMSPEAIDAEGVDPRSDLYCVGLVLYEMLTGTPPFTAAAPLELLSAQCTQPPPPLPPTLRAELPTGLESLLLRLLEKRRERRPTFAADVCRLLDGVRHARPDPLLVSPAVPAVPADSSPRGPNTSSSGKSVAIAIGSVLVGLVGVAGVAMALHERGSDDPFDEAVANSQPPPEVAAPDAKARQRRTRVVSAQRPDKPPGTPPDEPPSSADPPTGGDSGPIETPENLKTGVPECDRFLASYYKCIETKFPEGARAQVQEALGESAKAFKTAAEGSGRSALGDACRQSAEALATSMRSFGCEIES